MNVYSSHAPGCVLGHGDILWGTDLVLSYWGKDIVPFPQQESYKCGAAVGCVRVPEGLTKLQRNWRRSQHRKCLTRDPRRARKEGVSRQRELHTHGISDMRHQGRIVAYAPSRPRGGGIGLSHGA